MHDFRKDFILLVFDAGYFNYYFYVKKIQLVQTLKAPESVETVFAGFG
jgi:hypothetical protein